MTFQQAKKFNPSNNLRSSEVVNRISKSAQFWNIDKKSDDVFDLSITDEIGYWGTTASYLSAQIKDLPENATINLYIYSPGGSVIEGMEIFNALSSHKGKVHVTLGALCASIATIIALAGDTITAPKNSLFMIHNPTGWAGGDAEAFTKMAALLTKMKTLLVDAYVKKTGKTAEDISALMDETTWFTGEEAMEAKFIDAVSEPVKAEELEEIQDRFDLSHFKNCKNKLPVRNDSSKKHGSAPPADEKPKPPESNNNQQSTQFLKDYMSGKTRLFAISALLGSIAAIQARSITANNSITFDHTGIREPHFDNELTEEQKAEAGKLARELFKAKMARDTAIDELVVKIRNRDGKDFGTLAAKFKNEDKTAAEFALAAADSDEFKAFAVKDLENSKKHDIEVVGIRGLPVGSAGEAFIMSDAYKAASAKFKNGSRSAGTQVMVETLSNWLGNALDIVNTTSTTNGLTSIQKLPGVIEQAVRPLMVKDLLAPGATSSTTIRYIRETAFVQGADVVAQGAAKPEASFTFEEVDAPVRKIAVFTKMSDEMWMDFSQVASFINARLPYMVARKEEDQLLTGDGTGQNLTGLLSTVGTQTQAKGADTAVDAIYKSITKVRWGGLGAGQGGYEPDAIIMHPTNWEAIRLSKDANNQYFGGGPFTGAYGVGGLVQYEVLWGKPVVVTPAITLGTALTGSFKLGAQFFQRLGMAIESTNTDQDDFVKNLMTVRAETRLALAVYRPTAFCKVTGL